MTRRQAFLSFGSAMTALFGGCAALGTDESMEDQSYAELHTTSVYVDEGVDLTLPEEVPSVSEPYNARLVVLPDDPEIGPEQAVEWFADDRVLAMIGPDSEATWLEWIQSEAITEHFNFRGSSDAEPDPYLLVAVAIETRLLTYRHSWSGTPRNRDLLRALDEYLVDIRSKTRN